MVSKLVSNAVRFTQAGGVVVSSRVRGSNLWLQVWDIGPGINPAHYKSIFTEYFWGTPETESDNGVGLGLSVVKTRADLLGVQVSMRSARGRGSCISLMVPLATCRAAAGEALSAPSQVLVGKSSTEASV